MGKVRCCYVNGAAGWTACVDPIEYPRSVAASNDLLLPTNTLDTGDIFFVREPVELQTHVFWFTLNTWGVWTVGRVTPSDDPTKRAGNERLYV